MADTGNPSYSRHSYEPLPLSSVIAAWDPTGVPPSYWVDGFGICHLRGRVALAAQHAPGVFGSCPAIASVSGVEREAFVVAATGGLALVEIFMPFPWPSLARISCEDPTDEEGLTIDLAGITYPTVLT